MKGLTLDAAEPSVPVLNRVNVVQVGPACGLHGASFWDTTYNVFRRHGDYLCGSFCPPCCPPSVPCSPHLSLSLPVNPWLIIPLLCVCFYVCVFIYTCATFAASIFNKVNQSSINYRKIQKYVTYSDYFLSICVCLCVSGYWVCSACVHVFHTWMLISNRWSANLCLFSQDEEIGEKEKERDGTEEEGVR